MRTLRRTATLIAAVAVIAPATADASIIGRFATEGGGFTYSADPGETNDVTISRDGTAFLIDDPGAVIKPFGTECTSVNEHRVRCQKAFSTEFGETVSIDLGDGNDKARTGADLKPVVSTASINGEQGDDELTGSDVPNILQGGPGSDKLTGGAGTSSLTTTERLSIDDKAGHWIVQPDQATCAPFVGEYPGQFRFVTADAADTIDPSCGTPEIKTPVEPVDDAKGTKGKCEKSSTTGGAKRLVKSKYGVIFTKPKRFATYACLYKGGRIFALRDEGGGLDGGSGQGSKPVMNGRYVAYATRGSAIGDEIDRVVVWDMRNGFAKYLQVGPYIRKIVVKKNGSVAWISTTPIAGQSGLEVHRIQAEHEDEGDVTLERSTQINATSLKLGSGSNSVTWVSDGRTQTAELR